MRRFYLYNVMGEGALGVVYRAFDFIRQEVIALKVYREPNWREQQREAGQLRRLDHPNIVQLLDVITYGGYPALVLELADGGSLDSHLIGPMKPDVTLEVGRQIASALANAHAAGSVHGDLKPANVLVSGRLQLADFGMGNNPHCTVLFTQRGGGTPGYVAPEIVRGHSCSTAGDVYSLGAMLFRLLTGVEPATLARDGLSAGELDPAVYSWDTPDELAQLVRAATRVEPWLRPQAAGLAMALGQISEQWAELAWWRSHEPELQVLRTKANPVGKQHWNSAQSERGEFIDIVLRSPWHPAHRVAVKHMVFDEWGKLAFETICPSLVPRSILLAGVTIRLFMGPPPGRGERFSFDRADQQGFDYGVYLDCGHKLRSWGPDGIVLMIGERVLDWGYYGEFPREGQLQVRQALLPYLPFVASRPVGLPIRTRLPGQGRPELPWASSDG